MAPKREAREAQKGAKKGAKIEANRETPKWSQNVTKMEPKRSQNGAKTEPKWSQNERKTVKFLHFSSTFQCMFSDGFSMDFQWNFDGLFVEFQWQSWRILGNPSES